MLGIWRRRDRIKHYASKRMQPVGGNGMSLIPELGKQRLRALSVVVPA